MAALLLAGCVSVPAFQPPGDAPNVEAGMTTDEVVARWGEPETEVDRSEASRVFVVNSHLYEYPWATVYFLNGAVERISAKSRCLRGNPPPECYPPAP